MNYSEIKTFDISNGVGVRTSLFVSGCHFHCPGCFNQNTWDFDSGEPFTNDTIEYILKTIDSPNIDGLSILGGEPLASENLIDVLRLLTRIPSDKNVWLWTGYTYEFILKDFDRLAVLDYIDVLVDGPFIESESDSLLRFRGSANQRIIDIPKSLEANEIVMWTDGPIMGDRKWDGILTSFNKSNGFYA